MTRLWRWTTRWLHLRFRESERELPPLPLHPSPGLKVEKGESLTLTNIRVSLENVGTDDADPMRARRVMHVPDWASDFEAGATFQLRHPLGPVRFNVDGVEVVVGQDRHTLDVALPQLTVDPLPRAFEVAEKTLDLMTADLFLSSVLYEPLREHSVWWRQNDRTVLKSTWTERFGTAMTSEAIVRGADGRDKPPKVLPPRRWHASHAYFRESQVSDNLHDAYRNLFLALEALLSEIYPWRAGVGERRWLRSALKRACEGYDVDLASFLEGTGDPYKRFLKEQYQAGRCALFHAKLTLSPITPRDMMSRSDLAAATDRLARLYIELARAFTGARFAGSAVTFAGFEKMMSAMEGADMFVCTATDVGPANGAVAPATFERQVREQPGVHALTARFPRSEIPGTDLREAGVLLHRESESTVGMRCDILVDLSGIDELQLALQLEMVNLRNLRSWFF